MSSPTPARPAPTARPWLRFFVRSALLALLLGAVAVWLDYQFVEDATRPPLTPRRWAIGAGVWAVGLGVLTWLGRSAARAAGSDATR